MSIFTKIQTVVIVCLLGLIVGGTAQAELLNQSDQDADKQLPQDAAEFTSTTSVFGSWSVHCRENSQSKSCYAETILLSKQNKNREILKLRAVRRDDGILFIGSVPEGVALDAPILISVGPESRYPIRYRRCVAKRCSASGTLDFNVLSTMLKQDQIAVTFFTVSRDAENGRKPNTISVSLNGLEKALKALSR